MPVSFPLFKPGQKDKSAGPVDWLIVGLGNPGPKYAETRHNAGFHLLEALLRDQPQFRFNENKNKGLIARGQLAGVGVALIKPQTFMNLSGEAVGPISRFYKVPPQRILVAFDDLDTPPATLRLRPKGGAGGHKGMSSLIQHLGTEDFPRLRLGIGRPPGQMPAEAFVLQKFKAEEWAAMTVLYTQGVEAVKVVLSEGLEVAMNQFNVKS
jgi:PTH1 family peptidyl-tRNA hydrolase